jgi:hypothetical protein
MKPAEQIAQVTTPAKPRLVNMMTSLFFGQSSSKFDGNRINLSVLLYPSQSEVFWQGARAADHGGGKRRAGPEILMLAAATLCLVVSEIYTYW